MPEWRRRRAVFTNDYFARHYPCHRSPNGHLARGAASFASTSMIAATIAMGLSI